MATPQELVGYYMRLSVAEANILARVKYMHVARAAKLGIIVVIKLHGLRSTCDYNMEPLAPFPMKSICIAYGVGSQCHTDYSLQITFVLIQLSNFITIFAGCVRQLVTDCLIMVSHGFLISWWVCVPGCEM